ncbi:MAG: hypothetical protein IH892_12190 [Planctomycetes bacterium]|nr:hypothetical protein [Planctomycetota bacterium]
MAKKLFMDGQSTPIEANQREASRRIPIVPRATPIAVCAVPVRGWFNKLFPMEARLIPETIVSGNFDLKGLLHPILPADGRGSGRTVRRLVELAR